MLIILLNFLSKQRGLTMTYLHSLDTETKMKEDEMFDEFYAQLNNIVNLSFNLGEKIANKKIVRKILMSLPKRFRPQ